MPNLFLPRWQIGALTDAGVKRRDRPNEDSIGIFQSMFDPRPPLLVIADGMGGYKGGAFASRAVVEVFQREYRKAPPGQSAADLLTNIAHAAHVELHRLASKDADYADMGSTVVAAILGLDRVAVVNVGDSRAYLLHEGQLRQLSRDHSRVAELQLAGQLSEEAARAHPERSVLTMSLSPRRKEIHPTIDEVTVTESDTILLCTDGLWATLSPGEISTVLCEQSPQPAAEKLIALANMSQSPDNVTVAVARLVSQ